jgi:hypothetical protein
LELVLAAALLGAIVYSFVTFFRVFAQPGGLGVRRFAYLPVGLGLATLYAFWRLRRALRRYRDAAGR